MESMIQAYLEETEDLLVRAEERIIRLEVEYSSADINELFRIAHTIKGSSHMVGYEDIGNLMHVIEDMLDCARKGTIQFEQSIVTMCFEGLDTVKKMLLLKKEPDSEEEMAALDAVATSVGARVAVLIKRLSKETKPEAEPQKEPELQIVASLLRKQAVGHQYYVTFTLDEDIPMVSPILLMILKKVGDIGSLVYCSVDDDFFAKPSFGDTLRNMDVILSTTANEAELFVHFNLFYVENIRVLDLDRYKRENKRFAFQNTDAVSFVTLYLLYTELYQEFGPGYRYEELKGKGKALHLPITASLANLKELMDTTALGDGYQHLSQRIARLPKKHTNATLDGMKREMELLIDLFYQQIKGKYVYCVYGLDKCDLVKGLRDFLAVINRKTISTLFLDIAQLSTLSNQEVKEIIEIKRELAAQNIQVSLIGKGQGARRIINIFDSLRAIEPFDFYETELEAVLSDCLSAQYCQMLNSKFMESAV